MDRMACANVGKTLDFLDHIYDDEYQMFDTMIVLVNDNRYAASALRNFAVLFGHNSYIRVGMHFLLPSTLIQNRFELEDYTNLVSNTTFRDEKT